jgi:hypothetical protein
LSLAGFRSAAFDAAAVDAGAGVVFLEAALGAALAGAFVVWPVGFAVWPAGFAAGTV